MIKTIDINAKEWFDKVNGNSYFSAYISLNYGMEYQQNICLPFQYGYGDHYKDMAMKELVKLDLIKDAEQYTHGGTEPMWKYCERNKIILRTSKQSNCLKKDVVRYGIN